MNDIVTRLMALADDYAMSRTQYGVFADEVSNTRQVLQDELQKLFTPLSDEQIEEVWKAHVLPGFTDRQKFYSPHVFTRLIEQAHGIGETK